MIFSLTIAKFLPIAYLIGSIPFGLVLTRLAGLGDIRAIGSGNIGTTNVLRTGNKFLALLTFILDGGKGAAAMGLYLLAVHRQWISGDTDVPVLLLIGLAAMLGHCFPVWLRFKGGKGVATAFGVLLTAMPLVGLLVGLVWIFTAIVFRYSSLAAIAGAAIVPLAAAYFYGTQASYMGLAIAVLVLSLHHANIQRLLKGEEPKVGGKK